MSGLTGWWHRKSNAVKVELYTRWSFHTFGFAEVALVSMPAGDPLHGWLVLLTCAHAVLCAVVQSRALDWRLGRREQPVRLNLAVGLLSAASVLGVLVLQKTGALTDNALCLTLLIAFTGFGLAALSLGLSPRRTGYLALAAGTAVACVVLAAGELRSDAMSLAAGGGAGGSLGLVVAYAFSAWQVTAVWELDAARELQSRLAVAEERLRFGRDLHDVMGRNLAVIALKSELAVQLAERGRPEALAQMTEVQRIARETQREVRDVVRGYREADLHTELEGARGVLTAAGIDCRIEAEAGGGFSAEVQSALAWVVREATTNVLRHGDARWCRVKLSERTTPSGCEATLAVENDGAPDAGGEGPGNGSGLAGLRERLAALDGVLEAGPAAAGRFLLTARVPLPTARSVTPPGTGDGTSGSGRAAGGASGGAASGEPTGAASGGGASGEPAGAASGGGAFAAPAAGQVSVPGDEVAI